MLGLFNGKKKTEQEPQLAELEQLEHTKQRQTAIDEGEIIPATYADEPRELARNETIILDDQINTKLEALIFRVKQLATLEYEANLSKRIHEADQEITRCKRINKIAITPPEPEEKPPKQNIPSKESRSKPEPEPVQIALEPPGKVCPECKKLLTDKFCSCGYTQ